MIEDFSNRDNYRPEIDGLRAIAVVAVIAHHFSADLLSSGFLGVDIFFVISGYVISASLVNRPARHLSEFLLNFYARRIKRLLPALALCVLTTGILVCLFQPDPTITIKTGLTSLFGFSNIYLYRNAMDYFGESAQLNAYTHTWSLGVEEQFYLLFPLIIWFLVFRKSHAFRFLKPVPLLGALTASSFVAFILVSHTNPQAAYFLMPTRFWELSAGALLFFVLTKENGFFYTQIARVNSLLVGVALLATLMVPQKFFVLSTLLIVLSTMLLIGSLRANTLGFKILSLPTMVHLGHLSYSLYLWHWSVLAISRWTIGIHWWSVPIQITLVWVLAELSFRYVEKPLRALPWSIRKERVLAYGFTSLATVAVLLALLNSLRFHLYAGNRPNLVASGVASLTIPYVMSDGKSKWEGPNCVLSSNKQVGKTIVIDSCTLGNFDSARHRILVIGNSISAAFVQSFDPLVQIENFAVTITSSWGASPVPEIPNSSPWNKANEYYWAVVVPGLISKLQRGDWVFLINDLHSFSPKHHSAETVQQINLFEAGLNNLSENLSAKGIRVAVLHGNPFVREANCQPATAIRQWFAPFGGPCTFYKKQYTIERRSKLDFMLSKLSAQNKITLVDLMDTFCPEEICTYQNRSGQVLYRDEWSHPSIEAARLASAVFRNSLIKPYAN